VVSLYECEICGTAAEPVYEFTVIVADHWGTGHLLWERIRCLNNHHYDREVTCPDEA
jgi:hypothetical protein